MCWGGAHSCGSTCKRQVRISSVCLILLRLYLSLILELDWQAASHSDPPASTLHSAEGADPSTTVLSFYHGHEILTQAFLLRHHVLLPTKL